MSLMLFVCFSAIDYEFVCFSPVNIYLWQSSLYILYRFHGWRLRFPFLRNFCHSFCYESSSENPFLSFQRTVQPCAAQNRIRFRLMFTIRLNVKHENFIYLFSICIQRNFMLAVPLRVNVRVCVCLFACWNMGEKCEWPTQYVCLMHGKSMGGKNS